MKNCICIHENLFFILIMQFEISVTCRITRLRPVAEDVYLPGGYSRVANFDKIMCMECVCLYDIAMQGIRETTKISHEKILDQPYPYENG